MVEEVTVNKASGMNATSEGFLGDEIILVLPVSNQKIVLLAIKENWNLIKGSPTEVHRSI